MSAADQLARQRFTSELDTNFSVQASAGAGKTTALVARVAQVAAQHPDRLSRLVIVTYTNRAADEMRQRLRAEILSRPDALRDPRIVQGLARQFIGTIHGFCLRLLQEHAFALGYPSELVSVSENNPAPFREFLRASAAQPAAPWLPLLHRLVPERDLVPVAQKLSRRTVDWKQQLAAIDQDPAARLQTLRPDPLALDAVTSTNPKSLSAIARYQRAWKESATALADGGPDFIPLPPPPKSGGKDLLAAWPLAVGPVEDTYLTAARAHVLQLAAAFQEFRFESGQLYFSDQIVLARRLLSDPALRRELLGRGYRILLDEAQDTDPLQFALLAELAREPDSTPFAWPPPRSTIQNPKPEPPRPGHFVMVGDQQQAIYRDRASLTLYQSYHHALSTAPAGESLTFSQTFRCRPAIVSFVNRVFSPLFDGRDSQAAFVALEAQSNKGSGQVLRWKPKAHRGNGAQRMRYEVDWLADQIKKTGVAGLRARHWGEVAILCPKRAWLLAIQESLRAAGLPTQLAFEPPNSEFPEYLWLAALLTIHAEPNNEFEIIGILRELYGVSDDAIYRWRFADGPDQPRRFIVQKFENPLHPIEELLHLFFNLRETAAAQPLPESAVTWTAGVRLRERLHALPDGHLAVRQLDQLLLGAHAAQRRGLTLADWAAELRNNLDESGTPVAPEQTEAIQLMTFQKAKGLQWDAVLIPFLGKEDVSGGKSDYPKVLCPPVTAPVPEFRLQSGLGTPGWSKMDAETGLAAAQERRRLYYVACTRARHTLVLIDDWCVWTEELKKGVKLEIPNGYEALAPAFDPYQFQPTVLDQTSELLQDTCAPDSSPSTFRTPDSQIPVTPWPSDPSSPSIHHLPRLQRVRPSRHARDVESEAETDAGDEEGAPALTAPFPAYALSDPVRYGLWWHETMQRDHISAEAVAGLPETLRERGEKELAAFLRSGLYRTLQQAETLREIPYTREITPGTIEEGVIDMLYKTDNVWTLLDWKTDQVADPGMLVSRYRPQLEAYAGACLEFGLAVSSLQIYSTALDRTIEIPSIQ